MINTFIRIWRIILIYHNFCVFIIRCIFFIDSFIRSWRVYFINNFSANNEYLLLSFLLDKEYFWNLYDIEQQTNYTGNILEDDIHKLSDFPIENPNTLFAINEECLYFLISASQFIETTKKNKSYSQYVREKNISEEHNPILVKCRFKKKVSNI